MINHPKISVLMSVKNEGQHINECLYSILAQTQTDFEICIVDDHSSDNTFSILENFASEDYRIRVFRNKGNGIIDALHLAFQKSKGIYITRMDGDDIMPKNKLQLFSNTIEQNPDALVTGLVKYFSNETLKDGYKRYESWLNTMKSTGDHYTDIYKECVIASPNWMIRRTLLEQIGGFGNLTYPEDYDLCFQFYKSQIPIIKLNAITHLWRDHPFRASRNDPNYLDNNFFNLKLDHFLQLDRNSTKQLILWGAGKKAKVVAKKLTEHKIIFNWITNNPKKVNQNIYGIILKNESVIHSLIDEQVILVVSNPEESAKCKLKLEIGGRTQGKDFFVFC